MESPLPKTKWRWWEREEVTSTHMYAAKDHWFTAPFLPGTEVNMQPPNNAIKNKTKQKTWSLISMTSTSWNSHIPFSKFYELFKPLVSAGRRIPLSNHSLQCILFHGYLSICLVYSPGLQILKHAWGTVFPQPHLVWHSVPIHCWIVLRVSLKFIQCEAQVMHRWLFTELAMLQS